jgi:uncharacterized protein YcbX
MLLLRETLRPTLKAGQPDVYTPTLAAIDGDISRYRGEIELMIYPFKALGGISIDQAMLGSMGLVTRGGFRDRSAMLIQRDKKEQWKRFTQRDEPALAQVKLELASDRLLALVSPSGESVECRVEDLEPDNGTVVRAATYEDQAVEGRMEDPSGRLTQFIRSHLASLATYSREQLERIGVLLPHKDIFRRIPHSHTGGIDASTEFADVSKYLLINAATVDYVNEEIDPPVPAEAYRGNIIVKNGWPANLEDIIESADTGFGINLHFGVPSTRCPVTMVDPKTGIMRKDGEPLAALSYRRPRRNKKTTMGINIADGSEGFGQTIYAGQIIVPRKEKMSDV